MTSATKTIKDVAAQAGVSTTTVSRVLNGRGYVHKNTQAKVRDAMKALHYVPNDLARSLRSRQTSTLALLITDISNSFWTTISRGVEDEASSNGFVVVLCNTDENPTKEARYLNMLQNRRIDGLLIGPTMESAPLLRRVQEQHIPLVLLDRTIEGIDADVTKFTHVVTIPC